MTGSCTPLAARGREPLELVPGGAGFQLRAGTALLGTLEREGAQGSAAIAQAADGAWRFAGAGSWRGGRVTVTNVATGAEVAELRSRGVSGARGTATVRERALAYRSSGTTATRWELLDDGTPLVVVEGAGDERFAVTLGDPEPDSLLVLVACYGAMQASAAAAASAAI